MPITQNLDEILQQENKMQKMEQLLSQPPIKIKKKKEKCKRKKMNAIEKSIVWLMGIVGLCVINKMVPSLSMIYISFVSGLTILGGIKLVFDIKSIIKTKRAIDGLECQMYFLQNEIPLEQERLRNLYRKAKKIEGPKEEKIKKVNKINLMILKDQLEAWKYYGAHNKKYFKINKNDNIEIIGEEELKKEINTETYKGYLRLRRLKKVLGE